MDRAVSYLISNYNPKGRWIGWLMMASIIVEAWDLYSIAFVLIFLSSTPSRSDKNRPALIDSNALRVPVNRALLVASRHRRHHLARH